MIYTVILLATKTFTIQNIVRKWSYRNIMQLSISLFHFSITNLPFKTVFINGIETRLQFFKVCNMFREGEAVNHLPRNQTLGMHGFKVKNSVSFIIITIFQKRIRNYIPYELCSVVSKSLCAKQLG